MRTRYDEVWKGLETRNVTLEITVLHMEKYRRLVRNITIFLGRTEKRLEKLEPVGGDTDTIRRQISEHKVRTNGSCHATRPNVTLCDGPGNPWYV